MRENKENRFVVIGVKKEDLEDSISGLSQLKHFLQRAVIHANGNNKKQGLIDSEELGKHFDTAITAMIMMLGGLEED